MIAGPTSPMRGQVVPATWFVVAVATAVTLAGITATLLAILLSPGPSPPLPGVRRVLLDTQGLESSGDYEVEFNITSQSTPTAPVPVAVSITTNLTCQNSDAPRGPYCEFSLFKCPCGVEYVNYTWSGVYISGNFATDSALLTAGTYDFSVGTFDLQPPLASGPVPFTVSVLLLEYA